MACLRQHMLEYQTNSENGQKLICNEQIDNKKGRNEFKLDKINTCVMSLTELLTDKQFEIGDKNSQENRDFENCSDNKTFDQLLKAKEQEITEQRNIILKLKATCTCNNLETNFEDLSSRNLSDLLEKYSKQDREDEKSKGNLKTLESGRIKEEEFELQKELEQANKILLTENHQLQGLLNKKEEELKIKSTTFEQLLEENEHERTKNRKDISELKAIRETLEKQIAEQQREYEFEIKQAKDDLKVSEEQIKSLNEANSQLVKENFRNGEEEYEIQKQLKQANQILQTENQILGEELNKQKTDLKIKTATFDQLLKEKENEIIQNRKSGAALKVQIESHLEQQRENDLKFKHVEDSLKRSEEKMMTLKEENDQLTEASSRQKEKEFEMKKKFKEEKKRLQTESIILEEELRKKEDEFKIKTITFDQQIEEKDKQISEKINEILESKNNCKELENQCAALAASNADFFSQLTILQEQIKSHSEEQREYDLNMKQSEEKVKNSEVEMLTLKEERLQLTEVVRKQMLEQMELQKKFDETNKKLQTAFAQHREEKDSSKKETITLMKTISQLTEEKSRQKEEILELQKQFEQENQKMGDELNKKEAELKMTTATFDQQLQGKENKITKNKKVISKLEKQNAAQKEQIEKHLAKQSEDHLKMKQAEENLKNLEIQIMSYKMNNMQIFEENSKIREEGLELQKHLEQANKNLQTTWNQLWEKTETEKDSSEKETKTLMETILQLSEANSRQKEEILELQKLFVLLTRYPLY